MAGPRRPRRADLAQTGNGAEQLEVRRAAGQDSGGTDEKGLQFGLRGAELAVVRPRGRAGGGAGELVGGAVSEVDEDVCRRRAREGPGVGLYLLDRLEGEHAVVVNPGESVRDAKASDQKYYLLQTAIRHLPLVEFQATKINAALKSGQPSDRWLSPRQKTLLKRILVATEKEKNSLEGLQYPTKTSELAQYTSELVTRLDELESK